MSMLEDLLFKPQQRICPFCVEKIYPGGCAIVANVPKDKVLEPRPAVPLRYWSIMNPKPLTGPEYTRYLACRQCYYCNNPLPRNIETARPLSIAIVGDNRSGKSHYIAAMLKQLNDGRMLSRNQAVSLSCLTRETRSRYEREYFRPMFNQKLAFGRTKQDHTGLLSPLIYELSIRPAPDVPPTNANLIIYDAPGEDYMIEENLVTYAPYVLTADALIFLADPGGTFHTQFIEHLPDDVYYAGPGQSSAESLNAVIRLLERYHGKQTGATLQNIPIAIVLSKSDLFSYMKSIDNQTIFQDVHYEGGIDLKDIFEMNKSVRQLIYDNGGTSLLQASEAFQKKCFFAVSSSGFPPAVTDHSPDGQPIITFPRIEPRRCLDPLLWILHELGIITPE